MTISRRTGLALSIALVSFLAIGCSKQLYEASYYDDQHGVHAQYSEYLPNPYHEENLYYRGTPYDPRHHHHHHGY